MPVYMQNIFYYAALIVLVGGLVVGVGLAMRARREAREGVALTSEADMLSEFQRAREAGEMDEAEFRRVRDLLISGKDSQAGEHRGLRPNSGTEERPVATPPPELPTPPDPD